MPTPSEIRIMHVNAGSSGSGVDITDHVLFSSARFDALSGAGIGTFSLTIKDVERDTTFFANDEVKTGDEIRLFLNDTQYYGGYIQQIGRTFAFPAVDTRVLGDVTTRYFTLRGSNYNVLFDRLVAHNPDNHYAKFDSLPGTTTAGDIVTQLWTDYTDLDTSEFNVTTYVDNVNQVRRFEDKFSFVNDGEQGIPTREEMKWISFFNGAIYYFDAEKNLHYHAPEKVFAPWGFSDRPNKRSVRSLKAAGHSWVPRTGFGNSTPPRTSPRSSMTSSCGAGQRPRRTWKATRASTSPVARTPCLRASTGVGSWESHSSASWGPRTRSMNTPRPSCRPTTQTFRPA